MTVSKVLFSSNNQGWGTPPDLFHKLNEKYGPFKLDAATRESNPLNTPFYYTKRDNGLEKPWMNPTYVNPPYGRGIYYWVEKARFESIFDNLVVMLIPSRTDTKWFHEFIYKQDKVEYKFIPGRLRMYDYDKHEFAKHLAPFPSMIVIFHP